MLVQLAFYIAPFSVSIPTSILMAKRGYKFSLGGALALTVFGSLSLYFTLSILSFLGALISVFVVAMGVAALQVVANPYVTITGESHTATCRLTIASTLNSTGTTLGPVLLAIAMVTVGVANIYLILALVIAMIAVLIFRSSLIDVKPKQQVKVAAHFGRLAKQPQFLFGALMIFTYVGVEVAVGTVTISYLSDSNIAGLSVATATTLISLYWAGSLVGRLVYSWLANRYQPLKVLMWGALSAITLIVFAILTKSIFGGIALVMIGLCNSFMYPIIFSRAIENLGEATGAASAILVMCGIGGGVIPMLQASTIASLGIVHSYFVPILGYIAIASFSWLSNTAVNRALKWS
ncbi:glucose transporter [Aliivibrio fischeri]|uniref:Glucose/galactose transporter n=2 Tax=Aliivibrio fischeri TaxID=668 RepID=A0AAV3EP65_ALIFS|nr:glucose/galactose transporter [Aliivibrio fischeri SR5]OCH11173.1 glucose transporter [Aliivibrio fischeri]